MAGSEVAAAGGRQGSEAALLWSGLLASLAGTGVDRVKVLVPADMLVVARGGGGGGSGEPSEAVAVVEALRALVWGGVRPDALLGWAAEGGGSMGGGAGGRVSRLTVLCDGGGEAAAGALGRRLVAEADAARREGEGEAAVPLRVEVVHVL